MPLPIKPRLPITRPGGPRDINRMAEAPQQTPVGQRDAPPARPGAYGGGQLQQQSASPPSAAATPPGPSQPFNPSLQRSSKYGAQPSEKPPGQPEQPINFADALKGRYPEMGSQAPRAAMSGAQQAPVQSKTPQGAVAPAGSQWGRMRQAQGQQFTGAGQGMWEQTQPQLSWQQRTQVNQDPVMNPTQLQGMTPQSAQGAPQVAQGINQRGIPGSNDLAAQGDTRSFSSNQPPPPANAPQQLGKGANPYMAGNTQAQAPVAPNMHGIETSTQGLSGNSTDGRTDDSAGMDTSRANKNPKERETQMALAASGDVGGDPHDQEDIYEGAYGGRNGANAPDEVRAAAAKSGKPVDEDVAYAWGWNNDPPNGGPGSTWTGPGGEKFEERDGVLMPIKGDGAVTDKTTGLPINPTEGQVAWVGGAGQKFEHGAWRALKDGEGDVPQSHAFQDALDKMNSMPAPQMDTKGLAERKSANDAMYASKAAESMRAGLTAAARGGMSTEFATGQMSQIGQEAQNAGANANASAQQQADMANFQANIRQYDNQIKALEMAAQYATSEKDKGDANAQMQRLLMLKQGLEQQMVQYQQQATRPDAMDYLFGGLGAAGSLLGGIGGLVHG